jgi:hypothetical protein
VALFTNQVKKEYSIGVDILNKPWVELNNRSVIQDENRGQMMFNAFVDTEADDPNEAWKWRGTRSMARNKGIAMHANLTSNYLLPLFTAQNDDDDVDKDFSEVMRDIIEWMAMPNNSNYQSSFLAVVLGALTNPVTFLGAEYCEVMQKIKEKKEDGGYITKEIVDEVLSGFKAPIWSSSQVLITNAYERNIQKQRSIIKRRWVDKGELEAKYGEHFNWEYIQEGIKSIYNDEDGLFYNIKDDSQGLLVAEETYLNRRNDTEVCFVNGIYMGENSIDDNPIKHRSNKGAPKYNVVPFGYHRIGEHFFYYKSMMNTLGWDNGLYDAMSEVVMNRALLEVDMPIAISGTDKVDSEVIFPKSVVSFEDKDTKITPLLPGSNMVGGFNALRETEQSINDASLNETSTGQVPGGSPTAYSIAQANAGAKKIIGGVGKSIAESVVMYGDLMKDIAINNITVPQLDMLTGGGMKLKYRTFMLGNKSSGGKSINRKVKFDESLIGAEMSDEDKDLEEAKMLEEGGYPENSDSLIRVNPEMFVNFNYLSRVDVEEMFAKNSDYWQPVLTNLVTTLQNNPLADQEWLLGKLGYAYFQGEGEKLVKKQPVVPLQNPQGSGNNPLGAMVQNNSLQKIATGAGNMI